MLFVSSTNARSYLKQYEQLSGIWFRDTRHHENLPRALTAWYTPEGLQNLFKNDPQETQDKLNALPMQFAFLLRYY